ncbi:hypothetical protein [Pseudonocardia alni]|uniref:hypothetical protein n=1 Tax=Pseudonocardia alni TaxID=33907 RepID=UPI00386D45EA
MQASLAVPADEQLGIEVQPQYVESATRHGFNVLERNIFDLDLAVDLPWSTTGELLVVGNPPWVTNAQLGRLGSINLPKKANIKNLAGFDAMTGASNFDIAEYILLKLMLELQSQASTVAMLVKTQVARNVLSYAHKFDLPYSRFEIKPIDAKLHFNAAVDACLFSFEHAEQPEYTCQVFDDLYTAEPSHEIGFVNNLFVSNVVKYSRAAAADGASPVDWRSGVKHDASGVMEMPSEEAYENALEDDYIYPLLKCTDIFRGRLKPTRSMIVPQRTLGQETDHLQVTAPKLWSHLERNSAVLDGRKSSIYRGRPRFSVFGLGDYTFAPYKIAISGLHKEVRFVAVGPHGGRPVVFDDTCYMIPFEDGSQAAMTLAILESQEVRDLMDSLIFWDSKRPITKKLLQRIDLLSVSKSLEVSELSSRASEVAKRFEIKIEPTTDWATVLDDLVSDWSTTKVKTRKRRTTTTTKDADLVGLF